MRSDGDPALPEPPVVCVNGHHNPADHRYCWSCGDPLDRDAAPVWSSFDSACHVVTHPPHLRRTLLAAAVVGTLLFCINQLDVVLAGRASTAVIVKTALTYLVPFAVSNVGILIATHRPRPA